MTIVILMLEIIKTEYRYIIKATGNFVDLKFSVMSIYYFYSLQRAGITVFEVFEIIFDSDFYRN